ncbi:MAG: mitofusin [Geoglossum simile]|nr:MAG: mitofusin [Geoglossum simile]
MSQGLSSGGGGSSGGSSSGPSNSQSRSKPPGLPNARPTYVTVGSGSTSASAAALTAMLESDSGYGGSVAGDSTAGTSQPGGGWHPGLTEDMPTPSHTPILTGETSEACTCAFASYELEAPPRRTNGERWRAINQNRAALGRCINRTVEILGGLQRTNASWPAHYPSVQRTDILTTQQLPASRTGLARTQSTAAGFDRLVSPSDSPTRPNAPKRASTLSGEDSTAAESSSAAEKRPTIEPRLITSQIAQEFSILKLDLKLGALSQTELVHSLEKHSIASLLDGKISQSIRHLLLLRERIEDTSSKVLVTGDLNAGKSTFCNALLRRKVLPEDQQPCTSIFCEVLNASENGGVEEVHAVHKEKLYNRNDESTYDVYPLKELEKLVVDNTRYTQAKVYVRDIRSIDESLLSNGVVDISIIDAPGLNSDSLKTTAVFARQEEIDVVVFVVSAENHFTLSAKEFILNAAHEKAYIFIVVNRFDNIRDQNRCQRIILEQVAHLSPRTFKESAELVHFVSSNAIPTIPTGGDSGPDPPDDNADGDGDGDGALNRKGIDMSDAGKKDGDKGKGKEKEKIQDFESLEQALRRFVLEKRSRSKLAPAKTYLLNVLGDMHTLATVNRDVAQSEIDRVTKELQDLEPVFEQSMKARAEVSDEIDRTIDQSCSEIYDHTRSTLSTTIARVAEEDLGVPYPGFLNAFQYAEDIKLAMLDQISTTLISCEELARERTVQGVSSIKSLGLLHLGNEYADMNFRSDVMFRRKRDALVRQVNTEIEIWDFFDLPGLLHSQEKAAGTSMALTVVGVMGGRMVGGIGWADGVVGAARVLGTKGVRPLIIPGIALAVIAATAYAISQIPTTLPHRLSTKLSTNLTAIDYVHQNSDRVSKEVRKVLHFPADNLRVGLQRSVEKLTVRREETVKVCEESEVARKYFGNLVRESRELGGVVQRVDLEGPVAGGYES